jgi:hypothetical protein
MAEIQQLFWELEALEPIKAETILAGACVLTCHMFFIEKFLVNGKFNKIKARLVSLGNKQDREQFPDRSILMVLAEFSGNMLSI